MRNINFEKRIIDEKGVTTLFDLNESNPVILRDWSGEYPDYPSSRTVYDTILELKKELEERTGYLADYISFSNKIEKKIFIIESSDSYYEDSPYGHELYFSAFAEKDETHGEVELSNGGVRYNYTKKKYIRGEFTPQDILDLIEKNQELETRLHKAEKKIISLKKGR